jgi:hypothetical protein
VLSRRGPEEMEQRQVDQELEEYASSVPLFISGMRPEPKSAQEIVTIANRTKFFEAGRVRREGNNGSIDYVPREMVANATPEAFFNGLLLYKFTIEGRSPEGPQLEPGSYYLWLDFLPAAQAGRHEARWIGLIVSEAGSVACLVPGIEVKQVISFHVEAREDHGRPQILPHGVAQSVGGKYANSGWVDVQIGWEAFGAGCWKQIVCVPGT